MKVLASCCVVFLWGCLNVLKLIDRRTALILTIAIATGCVGIACAARWRRRRRTIAFFHPHAEDGGGGERVLWIAMKAVQRTFPGYRITLYTCEGHSEDELKRRALRNFGIGIESDFSVLQLKTVPLLNPDRYPYFTLLLQSLASIRVAFEACLLEIPEIFIDTSGWAFCYPLVWILGATVACYVHYPAISTDMLSRVQKQTELYNNKASIAKSRLLSHAKLLYYHLFADTYGLAGMFARVVMVNSTWTLNHIRQIWEKDARVVYPPVNTSDLQKLSISRSSAETFIVSIGQFRPEKNHALQLRAYASVIKSARMQSDEIPSVKTILSSKFKVVGSCRNDADQKRLQDLKTLAMELDIAQHVQFHENIPFNDLRTLLSGAVAGLHTMVDEHFGIGIVEYMAAGVIPIAHNSGGPKLDILSPSSEDDMLGYLRETEEGYAEAIAEVLSMNVSTRQKMAMKCRQKAMQFSQESFESEFLTSLEPILNRSD